MAVRGYKEIKKQKNANYTDFTALDNLNNKVLLRIIEPLGNEYIGINDVNSMTELIKREEYYAAFLISKKFTDRAVDQMKKQKIQHISDDYMPPFQIEELYLAIIDCVKNQCMKKCGKTTADKTECEEKKTLDLCKIRLLANNAKGHFEEGLVGLLKNDLKMALALNK
jgi:hypothetical protein